MMGPGAAALVLTRLPGEWRTYARSNLEKFGAMSDQIVHCFTDPRREKIKLNGDNFAGCQEVPLLSRRLPPYPLIVGGISPGRRTRTRPDNRDINAIKMAVVDGCNTSRLEELETCLVKAPC